MSKRILLLSGTSEGPVLARMLLAAGFEVLATVTREEARQNLFGPLLRNMTVETRGFTDESLAEFLAAKQADIVLDATHPFAVRITLLAHAVCQRLGVPFIRYERPDLPPPPGTRLVDSFQAAAEIAATLGSRVLLTIGAKQLKHFAHLHSRVFMMVRILPSVVSLEQTLVAGFTPDRVLCMRPPFSRAFNRAILEEYRIDVLVTKASGKEGGVGEKLQAAEDLGLKVVMIRRPELAHIKSFHRMEVALAACQKHQSERICTP